MVISISFRSIIMIEQSQKPLAFIRFIFIEQEYAVDGL